MANTLALEGYYDTGVGVAWTAVGATEKVWFQDATAFGYAAAKAIAVNGYNGGTHVIDAGNAEVCDTAHQANIEFSTDTTHYKLNGGVETLIDATHPATTECFRLHGAASPNAEITASGVFAYGGSEVAAPSGVTVYGVQPGLAGAWADIGGSAARISLGTSASAADHYKYVAFTVKPTSNGAKTGTIKGDMTFV